MLKWENTILVKRKASTLCTLACFVKQTRSHYKNHEASVKQSQFWRNRWSKISKNFDILASTHASLLHLLHTRSHSACVCFCFYFCVCVCFTSVNQALCSSLCKYPSIIPTCSYLKFPFIQRVFYCSPWRKNMFVIRSFSKIKRNSEFIYSKNRFSNFKNLLS